MRNFRRFHRRKFLCCQGRYERLSHVISAFFLIIYPFLIQMPHPSPRKIFITVLAIASMNGFSAFRALSPRNIVFAGRFPVFCHDFSPFKLFPRSIYLKAASFCAFKALSAVHHQKTTDFHTFKLFPRSIYLKAADPRNLENFIKS